MKETFVKEWHGIPLQLIKGAEKKKVPGAEFYAGFYEKFFDAHQSWKDLDPAWIDHKINLATFIQSRMAGFNRVLSIGCGIGVIEKYLLESGVKELEIQEVSEEPLRWIRPLFVNEAVHIGKPSECLRTSGKYDYIFLSCVDCCFDEQGWVDLLQEVKNKLNPEGRCLVITSTYHLANYSWFEICLAIKAGFRRFLSFLKIYDMGLMLGWRRSRDDFLEAMNKAGFESLNEGFLEKDALMPRTFWVEGSIYQRK